MIRCHMTCCQQYINIKEPCAYSVIRIKTGSRHVCRADSFDLFNALESWLHQQFVKVN